MKLFLFAMLFITEMFCDSLQNNTVKLDKDFFLLGTLDEYQGRYKRELIPMRDL